MKTHSHWFELQPRSAGMLAFMMQRISGIGLAVYLYLHLTLLNQLRYGLQAWNTLMQVLRSPYVLFLDSILLFGILIHGLNGLRLTLLGFGKLLRYQAFLSWACLALATILTFVGISVLR